MWEFWRSRLSKGKTRHRVRPGGSDDDSPTTARYVASELQAVGLSCPTSETLQFAGYAAATAALPDSLNLKQRLEQLLQCLASR